MPLGGATFWVLCSGSHCLPFWVGLGGALTFSLECTCTAFSLLHLSLDWNSLFFLACSLPRLVCLLSLTCHCSFSPGFLATLPAPGFSGRSLTSHWVSLSPGSSPLVSLPGFPLSHWALSLDSLHSPFTAGLPGLPAACLSFSLSHTASQLAFLGLTAHLFLTLCRFLSFLEVFCCVLSFLLLLLMISACSFSSLPPGTSSHTCTWVFTLSLPSCTALGLFLGF